MSLKNWLSLHIPTPEYMSMAHIGIDISPTTIHVVEIKKENGRLTLGLHGKQELSTPVDYAQPLIADEGLVMALKKIQKQYKLNFVEVSIPEEQAYIFTMDLPVGDEEVIQNHIELHLEENVPISLSEAVYSYYAVHGLETTGSAHARTIDPAHPLAPEELPAPTAIATTFPASVSVVPRTLIDQYVELFESAGMTPVSFLIENQALSKSLIKAGDRTTKLVVHVGDNKSVVSVVSRGSVHFTSTVKIGSEDFTNAIMREFSVTRDEAVRIKTERGSKAGSNEDSLFMSLMNTASALKDEIDRIVLYWQSYIGKKGTTANSIDGIILSGRDALTKGFKEYISATVRLPVETANVWTNVYNLDKEIPEINYADSLDYAVAIGLALPKIEG